MSDNNGTNSADAIQKILWGACILGLLYICGSVIYQVSMEIFK